jgi:hypothetical protein
MPTIITQTQDDKKKQKIHGEWGELEALASRKPLVQSLLDRPGMMFCQPVLQSTLDGSITMTRKPLLLQSTLDGSRMMEDPFPRISNRIRKVTSKSGIRVKSHIRKQRKDANKKNGMTELVPSNDPELDKTIRLAHKIQFDDLMRFRKLVFYNKKKS